MLSRLPPAMLAGVLMFAAAPLRAQAVLPPVTLGAGVQTSFVHNSPDGGKSLDNFVLNSVRLYVNGPVTGKIKFMVNTEYDGKDSKLSVLDAVARFEMSPVFNIWVGRFLPPSDRANLYGPYYSHHWAVYTDGIQDGYPFLSVGRDNGVTYWGDFDKVKVSAGVFDGTSTTGNSELLVAARAQVDLWDPEGGYYLNGTYYGGKDLLAIGGAVQEQDGNTASNVDFLLEKKLPSGVVSIESEYADYDALGGYDSRYALSKGGYVLGSFLFPKPASGMGQFELLGKYAKANFSKGVTPRDVNYDQKTTEFNLNYIIKEFNARVMFFIKDTRFSALKVNFKQAGVGIQLQM